MREKTPKIVAITLILAFSASLVTGCAYLRLLKFKSQLKNFDETVVVDLGNTLSLDMKLPILRDSDFVFLTESQPNQIIAHSEYLDTETWVWEFFKMAEDNTNGKASVTFRTQFEDHLLTRLEFGPTLTNAIPKEFVVRIMRSIGQAKINKLRRTARADVAISELENIPIPTYAKIRKHLGPPTRISYVKNSTSRIYEYVFNFQNPDTSALAGQFSFTFRLQDEKSDNEIVSFYLKGKGR